MIVADRPVDISVYMSQLQLLYNETQVPAIRKLISQDMDKGTKIRTALRILRHSHREDGYRLRDT